MYTDFDPAGRPRRGAACGCLSGGLAGAVLSLAFTLVFCGMLYVYVTANAPTPPIADFTPQPAQAESFELTIRQAENTARQGGTFNVQVTEAEASSWLNLNAEEETGADIPLDNMQASFRGGRGTLYGELNAFGLAGLPTQVDVSHIILPDGRVDVNVDAVRVSGLAVPASVRQQIATELQRAIDTELNRISGSYRVEQIIVNEGVLIVQGRTGP
ncbi:MAG: hypothetical protein ACLFTK_11475 [Anaerolineales bacterium]